MGQGVVIQRGEKMLSGKVIEGNKRHRDFTNGGFSGDQYAITQRQRFYQRFTPHSETRMA